MVFIPPPPILPPKQDNKKRPKSRLLQNRLNSSGSRSRMGKIMSNPLGTTQGVSTLKIVLIYSIVGMILNWVLPIVILQFNPEMMKEDAHYYGSFGAIIITGILLIVTLVNQLFRSSKSQSDPTKTHGYNTDIYRQDTSERNGNIDGR